MNADPNASKNIVAEAVDRGINYFDVAPATGMLRKAGPGPAAISVKKSFWPAETDGRMKEDSRKDLEESLKLLQTDHLDRTSSTHLPDGDSIACWTGRRHGDF